MVHAILRASLTVIRKPARIIYKFLPEANFITLHYAYFVCMCLLSALIFWGSSTSTRIGFIDALFLCVSAMTEAGLNTVNLSTLNTWQQFMLFGLIIIGSAIWVSVFVVFARLRAFRRKFANVIEKRRLASFNRRRSISRTRSFFSRGQAEAGTARASIPLTSLREDEHTKAELAKQNLQSFSDGDKEDLTIVEPGRHIIFDKSGKSHDQTPPLKPLDQIRHESMRRSGTFGRPSRMVLASPSETRHPLFSFTGTGANATASLRPRSTSTRQRRSSQAIIDDIPPPRSQPTDAWFPSKSGYFSRNSQVHGLTAEERRELGGKEYSAVKFLSILVPLYFIMFQLLGSLGLGAWVAYHRPSIARENGMNPWWVGAFNAVSAFNNSGMSLLDANMVAFHDSIYMLLTMGLLILAGNTAYPCFLRLAIWTSWKILPNDRDGYWAHEKANLRFLLDHPRRCYTNLFPALHTWWLAAALVVLNGIDWAAFEVLNIGNDQITSLPGGIEVLDGLFQALAVRSGGFYVVPIPSVRISLQILYVYMMYISAYPVTITMRHSNVYEERSLGIFAGDDDYDDDYDAAAAAAAITLDNSTLPDTHAGVAPANPRQNDTTPRKAFRLGSLARRVTLAAHGQAREHRSAFVRHQLRAQLAHDAWWIALAVLLISIIENAQFVADPVAFSVFNVLFEVVSGYACVGLSVGVPTDAYSFAGSWHALSKLVLCAVMLRGRHRGLPVAIDHAVQLPGERGWAAEEEDGRWRLDAAERAQSAGAAEATRRSMAAYEV